MWPTVYIKFDILYAMGILNLYCANPDFIYCKFIIQVLHYFFGTLYVDLIFRFEFPNNLIDYTDSNWTGSANGRRLTKIYVLMFADVSISHQFKQQLVVILFLCKIKYIAIIETGGKKPYDARVF